jgi:hypothetical protein
MSRRMTVSGVIMINPETRQLEVADQIDAPDELPALQNANFEIWKLKPAG